MQREPEDEESLSRSLWGKPTLLFPGVQGLQIRTCSTPGDRPEPLTILGKKSVVSRVWSVQAPGVALGTYCCLQMCLCKGVRLARARQWPSVSVPGCPGAVRGRVLPAWISRWKRNELRDFRWPISCHTDPYEPGNVVQGQPGLRPPLHLGPCFPCD